MKQESEAINYLCSKLPFKLANQIFKENQSVIQEINGLLEHSKKFKRLNNSLPSIKLLVALAVFNKRVIQLLQDACFAYDNITSLSNIQTINIGNYDLTLDEKNKIFGATINFNNLLLKYQIDKSLFVYESTYNLLENILDFYFRIEND